MTNTKELIEELRVQANQHPCDADLLQFDIAATALGQLEERCAELERELEWMQIKYNTEMRIRQAYQSGSEEVARRAFVAGYELLEKALDGSPIRRHNVNGFADQYAQREYGVDPKQ
jgi:hypothetical protein